MEYKITDEGEIPGALLVGFMLKQTVQVETAIGWITVDTPEFRNGCTYRVLDKE